ncbi:MAG: CehA/McbA family metallohydrolase [Halobacteriales archaeon]
MVSLRSPYAGGDDSQWLRGNLHTHTDRSDGELALTEVVDTYESEGYDFLAISDHNILFDPDTHQSETSLLLLGGVEVSTNDGHLLYAGASERPSAGDHVQTTLDTVGAGPGLGILAHPNWNRDHYPTDRLARLQGYAGIEIFNVSCVDDDGRADATEHWDRLLSAGRRPWGFATDDSHRPGQVARAWTSVQVDERTPEAVLRSLRTGRFYASTGVRITDVSFEDGLLTVATESADQMTVVTDGGRRGRSIDDSVGTFEFPTDLPIDDPSYVRVACFGTGDDRAWTQPLTNHA